MTTTEVSAEVLERTARRFMSAVRSVAPAPGQKVGVSASDWAAFGLAPRDAIAMCRLLASQGQLLLPDYSNVAILAGQPPSEVALTQNAWERYGSSSITIYGPTLIGDGEQYNSGSFSYQWDAVAADLTALLRAVEALHTSEEHRAELAAATATLQSAVKRQSLDEPGLRATIEWLGRFARDSGSAATGALIATLVAAVLPHL